MFRVLCMLQLWVLKQYKSNFATFPHFVCATKKFVFWKIGLALKKTKNWKNSSFSIADLSMPVHISNLYKHWIKSFNSHNLWHFTTFFFYLNQRQRICDCWKKQFFVSNVSVKCFWLILHKESNICKWKPLLLPYIFFLQLQAKVQFEVLSFFSFEKLMFSKHTKARKIVLLLIFQMKRCTLVYSYYEDF